MFRSPRDSVRTPKKMESEYLNTEAFYCDMCDKGGWSTPNDVEIHKKNSHAHIIDEYRFKHRNRFCTVCMTLLDSSEELIKHIKSQHLLSSPNAQRVERHIYICNECSGIFFNKDILKVHMLSVHVKKADRINKQVTCPKCFGTLRLPTIWFHLHKHEIPSISLCDICLTNCPSRPILLQHIKSHDPYLRCEPCGYSSKKFLNYEIHIEEHLQRPVINKVISPFLIDACFKKAKTTSVKYNVHNAIKGLRLPQFMQICTLCREICVSLDEINRHILRDHVIVGEIAERKRHLCGCGEEFEYKVVLKQHLLKMKGHYAVDSLKAVSNESNDKSMETTSDEKEFEAPLAEIIKIKDKAANMEDTTPNDVCENMEPDKSKVNFATLSPVLGLEKKSNKKLKLCSE